MPILTLIKKQNLIENNKLNNKQSKVKCNDGPKQNYVFQFFETAIHSSKRQRVRLHRLKSKDGTCLSFLSIALKKQLDQALQNKYKC